jgi:hypothetical protein
MKPKIQDDDNGNYIVPKRHYDYRAKVLPTITGLIAIIIFLLMIADRITLKTEKDTNVIGRVKATEEAIKTTNQTFKDYCTTTDTKWESILKALQDNQTILTRLETDVQWLKAQRTR